MTLTGAWPYDEPPDCSFEAPRDSAGDAFRAIAMDEIRQWATRRRSLSDPGDCDGGGDERKRGTAGQHAHALPMQQLGQETLGRTQMLVARTGRLVQFTEKDRSTR